MKEYILREDKFGIISEFKRQSPSKGKINEFADVENASKMEGNNMHMLFAPKKAPTGK